MQAPCCQRYPNISIPNPTVSGRAPDRTRQILPDAGSICGRAADSAGRRSTGTRPNSGLRLRQGHAVCPNGILPWPQADVARRHRCPGVPRPRRWKMFMRDRLEIDVDPQDGHGERHDVEQRGPAIVDDMIEPEGALAGNQRRDRVGRVEAATRGANDVGRHLQRGPPASGEAEHFFEELIIVAGCADNEPKSRDIIFFGDARHEIVPGEFRHAVGVYRMRGVILIIEPSPLGIVEDGLAADMDQDESEPAGEFGQTPRQQRVDLEGMPGIPFATVDADKRDAVHDEIRGI